MAGGTYTSPSVPFADTKFNGGLNTTAAPLNLQDNESSDLQNIDFDKFGSILKRNGYACLNTNSGAAIGCDGLVWFTYIVSANAVRQAVRVYDSKVEKMDSLDGVWDNITGGVTITSANFCDFEIFNNSLFITNGENLPVKIATSGTAGAASGPANLETAKYVKVFQNYLFYGAVEISGNAYLTRVYWSAIRNDATWDAADWLEISKDDGQMITGLRVLANALVVFKTNSIYNVYFTGDADIPFIMQKSNSAVGCIAPFSIQEAQGGLVFFSSDGFYYYDGTNSYKISDRINNTIIDYQQSQYSSIRSLAQRNKNRIWWAMTSLGQTQHDKIVVWDYFNNAWSVYDGINASALATFMVSGYDERPYFHDYNGFTYRADIGTNDYPLNTATAIDAYYWTNWKAYADAVNQKGVPHIYVYFENNESTVNFSYGYDFEDGMPYSTNFITSSGFSKWDSAIWDESTWAGSGGGVKRLDLTSRGRVIRFKFANAAVSETFRIDAFGSFVHLETMA